jgi:hypothetical protein
MEVGRAQQQQQEEEEEEEQQQQMEQEEEEEGPPAVPQPNTHAHAVYSTCLSTQRAQCR